MRHSNDRGRVGLARHSHDGRNGPKSSLGRVSMGKEQHAVVVSLFKLSLFCFVLCFFGGGRARSSNGGWNVDGAR